MSTVACAAIQIINPPTGFPNAWKTSDGAVFLDMGENFDFGLTKNVEQLTDINELEISGVYGFAIPDTPINRFVCRDWMDPNTFDFQSDPIIVRAFSGGTVLSQTYLYVRESRRRDKSIECMLLNDESHWAVGASRLKLNEIEYDDFQFTYNNVLDNMQSNAAYADGDAGFYYQLAHYGNLFRERRISVEYVRPWFHALGVLHKGFKQLGWRFECPWLETDVGRQIICYLLDPDFGKVLLAGNEFRANLNEFRIEQRYNNDNVDKPRIETINYDVIIDDPSGSYSEGRYYGFGEYAVEAAFTFNNSFTVSHDATIQIVKFKGINDEGEVIKEVKGGAKNLYLQDRELVVTTDSSIVLLPGEWIEIRYKGESNGRSPWNINFIGGRLKITPTKVFPLENDTINPGKLMRPDEFLTFCKGILHLITGKVDTELECKTVRFLSNYKVDYYGTEIPGFYFSGSLVTVDPSQLVNSEVVVPPDTNEPRYKLLTYKKTTDARLREYEEGLQYPFGSRLVDLGPQFKDGKPQELENPYFEATLNEWIDGFTKLENGIAMDLPVLLDHTPTDGKIQFSTNIGPRIIYTRGWEDVQYKSQDGTLYGVEWFLGHYLIIIIGNTSYPWGFNLAVGFDSNGDPPEESLVYGERDDDLYNKFWKRYIYEFYKSFTVSLLCWLWTRDFNDWDLRRPYAFLVDGKRTFGSLLTINQFQACSQVSTEVILKPNAATVGQYPEEPNEEDPCDSYTYELTWNESSCTWTFTVNTDSPGNITIEWRYYDETTWTEGNVVSNPDRLFYVRVLDDQCGDQPKRVQPIDPCGTNNPVLEFAYRFDEDANEHCVTATIGGIIEDVILSTDFQVSINGGPSQPYTIGTEVCSPDIGQPFDFCFAGTVEFDNCNCADVPVDGCYTVPPDPANCDDNLPNVDYVHVGLDVYQLRLAGNIVSPPSVWFFQYRDVNEADETKWKIWDTKSPISKTTFQARVIMYFCDECPPVCGPWVTIPTPMGLTKKTMDNRFDWDFSKLSEDDWFHVEHMIKNDDQKGLMKLHNDRRLSTSIYCCGRDGIFCKNHFEHGLNLRKRSPKT